MAGYFYLGTGALRGNLLINLVVCVHETRLVKAIAEHLGEHREQQRQGGPNLAPAPIHRLEAGRIPGHDRVEQVEYDRLEFVVSHAASALPPCSLEPPDSKATLRR